MAIGVLFGANFFLVLIVLGTVILATKLQTVEKVLQGNPVGPDYHSLRTCHQCYRRSSFCHDGCY
jgi:Ca2+/Na+ antiporter